MQGSTIMEFVTPNNGVQILKPGFGMFMVHNEEIERCLLDAIDAGYSLIDTAQAYGNEEGEGNAGMNCCLAR